jgi:hypothetical protein
VSGLSVDGAESGSGEKLLDPILAIARDVLAKPGITADDELTGHGGTSLAIVRIIALASRTLDLEVNPRELGGTVTVRGMARVARGSSRRPPASLTASARIRRHCQGTERLRETACRRRL